MKADSHRLRCAFGCYLATTIEDGLKHIGKVKKSYKFSASKFKQSVKTVYFFWHFQQKETHY